MTARGLALSTGVPLELVERAEVGEPVAALDLVLLLHAVGTTLAAETQRLAVPRSGRRAWPLGSAPGVPSSG